MNRKNFRDKDLKNNYLRVDREGCYGEKYEETLLYKQNIPGILTFYELKENDESMLVYELNGKMSWVEMLQGKRMGCYIMESFIKSLVRVMETVDEFLLEPSDLVMEMSFIFTDNMEWFFLYIPGYKDDFWIQMGKLGEEWLNWVDYGDERAVLWAYTFYERVHKENCKIQDLSEIIRINLNKENQGENLTVETEDRKMDIPVRMDNKQISYFTKFKQVLQQKNWCFFKRKQKNAETNEFYEIKKDMGDTLPILNMDVQSETFYGLQSQKAFLLIPVGENETPVICVEKFPFLLGRAPEEADGCLMCQQVSRLHARLDRQKLDVLIVDMNSANGTFRNNERLKPGVEYTLHTGDILKLADQEFICQF